jgi:hypothetical protein
MGKKMSEPEQMRLYVEKQSAGEWVHVPNGLLGIVKGDHFRMLIQEGDNSPVIEATATGIATSYLDDRGTLCGEIECETTYAFSENIRPIM